MRVSKDEWLLTIAVSVSTRSTCLRRMVGCVLANALGQILSTGYNGVPVGFKHCNESRQARVMNTERTIKADIEYPNACPGAFEESGARLEDCYAIHAEQNALLQCPDVYKIYTCYTTHFPCVHCIKLLLNTSCQRIVYDKEYSHQETSERLWIDTGRREVVKI